MKRDYEGLIQEQSEAYEARIKDLEVRRDYCEVRLSELEVTSSLLNHFRKKWVKKRLSFRRASMRWRTCFRETNTTLTF